MLFIFNRIDKALISLEKVSLKVTFVYTTIHVLELTRAIHLAFLPATLVDMSDCPFIFTLTFNVISFETAFVARSISKDLKTLTVFLITIPTTFVFSNYTVIISLSVKNLKTVAVSDLLDNCLNFFIKFTWNFSHNLVSLSVQKSYLTIVN